jgi:Phage integrase, N-terminal SAM-like domain.
VESAFFKNLLKEVIDMASMKGRHNRIKYFFIETVKGLFEQGYGKSKYEAFQRSFNEDRTRRSNVIHSFSTLVSYETTAAKFGDFLSEMGVKTERDFRKLSSDQVREYLDKYFEKQQQEGLAKKTLQRQIAAINKLLGAIDPNLKELFTPENRMQWRNGLEPGDNDRYNNPTRVAEELRKINEISHAVCQLQRLTGVALEM